MRIASIIGFTALVIAPAVMAVSDVTVIGMPVVATQPFYAGGSLQVLTWSPVASPLLVNGVNRFSTPRNGPVRYYRAN